MSTVASRLTTVCAAILTASQRLGLKEVPRLVAVSKLMPASLVQEAFDHGHRHFGENYVQELIEKSAELPADINWHFIGHLQSNKCKMYFTDPTLLFSQTLETFFPPKNWKLMPFFSVVLNRMNSEVNLESKAAFWKKYPFFFWNELFQIGQVGAEFVRCWDGGQCKMCEWTE